MTSEGLVEMLMGGRAEGLACADLGARTPIGVSGILQCFNIKLYATPAYCNALLF